MKININVQHSSHSDPPATTLIKVGIMLMKPIYNDELLKFQAFGPYKLRRWRLLLLFLNLIRIKKCFVLVMKAGRLKLNQIFLKSVSERKTIYIF